MRLSEISRLGGIEISIGTANNILISLGFETVVNSQLSTVDCVVPYWRTDILCEADLVEEVLRLYGYENIPASLPPFAPPADISAYAYRLDDEIRDVMQKIGFDEVMTEPLTSTSRYDELSRMEKGLKPVKLQNALNTDKSMLRFVMDEGLRHALSHHQKFGKSIIKLFELGKVYSESTDQNSKQRYHEPRHAAFVLHDMQSGKEEVYRQSKGIVEMLCKSLGISYSDDIANYHMWDEHTVYTCMNLEHNFAQSRRMTASSKARLHTSIPRIQSFDISCLVSQSAKVGEIISSIQNEITSIESISIPELPRKQDVNQKSVLFHIILKDDTADKAKVSKQVEAHLLDRYKVTIR
jgi:phenylalanyl-tRNA synthetase beta subunit